MSILAKKETIIRLVGMVILFLSIIFSLIYDFFILDTVLLKFYILLIEIPWLILIILLKLEKDFFVENALKLAAIIGIFSTIMIILGTCFNLDEISSILFVILSIESILISLCWHFTLSIYKKEKLFFLLSGLISIILLLITVFLSINISPFWVFVIFPLIFIIIGLSLVLLVENKMKKENLLNYI